MDSTRSGARWEEHRRRFEAYLEGLHFSAEPRLSGLVDAMRYSMLGGGKRVRPTLCMEAAWVFGQDPEIKAEALWSGPVLRPAGLLSHAVDPSLEQ